MKKRNTLRALGVLVIFAVLGLHSACENFSPYEPEGGRLLLDKDTLAVDEPLMVTVIISSKIKDKDAYDLRFSPDDHVNVVDATDLSPFASGEPVLQTTTFIFTVDEANTDTSLTIEIWKNDVEITDRCEVAMM